MTDRELLELAAKAAGIEHDSLPIQGERGLWIPADMDVGEPGYWWNPLLDDGDVFRLAVKLRLRVDVDRHYAIVMHAWIELAREPVKSNPLAATRRAIVRAAAEIGKGMKE